MTLLRLGALLRERRGGRGVRQVAEEVGISSATLTRVEAGKIPDLFTFKKICAWLKINPAEILDIPLEPNQGSEPTESSSLSSAVHLRAEHALPPQAATDLAQLIVVAHRELQRRAREQRTDVSTWL